MTIVWEVLSKRVIKHVLKDNKHTRCGKRGGKNFVDDGDMPEHTSDNYTNCPKCWRGL